MIDEEIDFLAECLRRKQQRMLMVSGADCIATIRKMPRMEFGEPYIAKCRGFESIGHSSRIMWLRGRN